MTLFAVLALSVCFSFTHTHTHTQPLSAWDRPGIDLHVSLSLPPLSPFRLNSCRCRLCVAPLFVNSLLNFAAVNAALGFFSADEVHPPRRTCFAKHYWSCDSLGNMLSRSQFKPGWHREEMSHSWTNVPLLNYSNKRVIKGYETIYVAIFKLLRHMVKAPNKERKPGLVSGLEAVFGEENRCRKLTFLWFSGEPANLAPIDSSELPLI